MFSNNPIHPGLIVLCYFIASTSISSQSSNADQLASISSNLAEKYEEESIAILNSTVEYTFFVEQEELQVRELTLNQYIGLKEFVDFAYVQFYDEKSSIKYIGVRNEKGKKIQRYLGDRKYENQDYFHTDARVKYIAVDPTKGTTQQVKSEKITLDAKYFTKSLFHSLIPIVEKTVKFVIPEDVEVELVTFNFEEYSIDESQSTDSNSNAKIYTYSVKNLDPIPDERNSPGSAHFLPHILVLPKSYMVNGSKKTIFQETKDMYGWYRSLVKSMDNQPDELKALVADLINGIEEEEEKIKKLYYWVQDNIRYIAFEDGIAGFKPDECQSVFKKRFGDCKGMANLLKEMLIIAGFDARLTWIGTDHLPYDYSTPSLAVDNHMICTLFWKGEKHFLDPTEKYNPLGYNASRIRGKEVMIEDGEQYIIAKVPEFQEVVNADWLVWDGLKIENDKLLGKGEITFGGERLTEVLNGFNNIDASNREEAIERLIKGRDKNFIVSDLKHSDSDNRDDNFVVSYDMELNNMVTGFNNDLFLDLDYYKEFGQSKLEDRKTDYLFRFKFNIKNKLSVEIPEGYAVEEIPAGLDIENEFFTIKTDISEAGGQLRYEKLIALKKRKIPMEAFGEWNTAFGKLGAFYQEQVVLSKK